MELEEVKTWQWVLAGLVVGFAFSCIVAWTGPTFDTQARDTIEQGEFENATFGLTKFGEIPWLVRQYHHSARTKIPVSGLQGSVIGTVATRWREQ